MKILVTGAKGQLGRKITDLLSNKYDLILTDIDNLDITNHEDVINFIDSIKPDFIIHGAAYTKVDAAEDEKELCYKINALGTQNITEAAKKYNATVIYISTDYVFDGEKNIPYIETDEPNPLSVYGQTKLAGEKFIQEICDKYYILRVSWLFGELPENHPGTNFIETMLRLAEERDSLNIVNDQIGSPTYTKDLVEVIDKMIDNRRQTTDDRRLISYGIYHFSGNNPCSWYDFAMEIFLNSGINIKVKPITSAEYPQKAKRPAYSYMSKEKIEKALNINVRSWQEMVGEYIKNKSY